jgi:hypothetical protein
VFYPELIDFLRTDAAITGTVNTYEGAPSIFSDESPEGAERPYIVVRIATDKHRDSVMMLSDVYIDYYDFNTSRVTADAAANAITDRLDTIAITSANLTDIRFSLMSRGYIRLREDDPRMIHHNSTFSTRAARSRWMQIL